MAHAVVEFFEFAGRAVALDRYGVQFPPLSTKEIQ
jgi:hypothetical protein